MMTIIDRIDFTKQSRLDRFGKRWGCFFTALLNIIELENLGRLLANELYMIVGYCFFQANVYMSNYKKHEDIWTHVPEGSTWSAYDDPEAHYYIKFMNEVVRDMCSVMGIIELTHEYVILECELSPEDDTPNTHFQLEVDGKYVINPDPNLDGPVISRREVTYG